MPPQAPPKGTDTEGPKLAAASLRLSVLSKRSDFLRASRAPRVAMPGFILQMRVRPPGEADGMRVGFTCSKKVGNAVARNRAKRRLREIARLTLPILGQPDSDYVLIGRAGTTISLPFSRLLSDLESAVKKIHGFRK